MVWSTSSLGCEETDRIYSFGDISHEMVIVEVGQARQEFNVHLNLLCKHSTHFNATLQEQTTDEAQKSLLLPDVTVDTFKHFLDWLYFSRTVSTRSVNKDLLCQNCDEHHGGVPQIERTALLESLSKDDEQRLEELIANILKLDDELPLYIFAYHYNISALRQAIVDQSWKFFRRERQPMPWFGEVIALSRSLPAKDPLLRLLSDTYVRNKVPEHAFCCPDEARLVQKLPYSLLCRVWLASAIEDDDLKNLCHYHEHAQDEDTVNSCGDNRKMTRKRKREEFDEDSEHEKA